MNQFIFACSNFRFVVDDLFPVWGLEYVTTWYWLKVKARHVLSVSYSDACLTAGDACPTDTNTSVLQLTFVLIVIPWTN